MANRMTQEEVVGALAKMRGMTKEAVSRFLGDLCALAAKELRGSGEFVAPGLARMKRVRRKARQARNPKTGEVVQVPARTAVRIRPAKSLKDAVSS